MKLEFQRENFSAMRWVATIYGTLVGLAGIEHGIFEILQGDNPTTDIMINAIGEAYKFWLGSSERALTIIPNFLWTGILAVVFGIIVVIWATFFVERKYGASVMFILTITLFLVGGGFAPIFVSILSVAAATKISKPLSWWREHFPAGNAFANLWPSILILFVIVFWSAVGIQIFGLPLAADVTTNLMMVFSVLMIVLLPIAVMVGLAFDAQKNIEQ
jgi:hypothetical protein